MTIVDIIRSLEATPSRLQKDAIVQAAWDDGQTEFFTGVQMAYSISWVFNIRQLPEVEPGPCSKTFAEFMDLATKLAARELSGNAARDAIDEFASHCGDTWNYWYGRILAKDLDCGITETTVNAVLDSIGRPAQAFKTAVFKCQLAQDSRDHPKKMTGLKFLDRKYDGVRLLSVVDPATRTVSQYTRNGAINHNFAHLRSSLAALFDCFDEAMVLDGEVISASFRELMTQVNRQTDVDTTGSTYMLFDIVPLSAFQTGVHDVPQHERHRQLERLPAVIGVTVEPKILVDMDTDHGQSVFNEFFDESVTAGLEGIMVKSYDAPYVCKKFHHWLKLKPKIHIDLTIVGFNVGTGKNAGRLGSFQCEGWEGDKHIVTDVAGMTDQQRQDFWDNRDTLLGTIIQVEADAITQNKSGGYGLRFPQFQMFRETVSGAGKI